MSDLINKQKEAFNEQHGKIKVPTRFKHNNQVYLLKFIAFYVVIQISKIVRTSNSGIIYRKCAIITRS